MITKTNIMMEAINLCKEAARWVVLMLLICIPLYSQAQSLKRQCISSICSNVSAENIAYGQTIGQPFSATASYNINASLLPGFQQPVMLKVEHIDYNLPDILKINIFPNPASSMVIIQSGEIFENPTISVADCSGKVIMRDKAEQLNNYVIDCSGWATGIYIISITDNIQRGKVFKLIITK